MGNESASVEIKLKATANPSGVREMKSEVDALTADLKSNLAAALSAEGATPEFIQQALSGMDALIAKLNTAGDVGLDRFNSELEKMVLDLQEAAAAEAKRIEQAKIRAAEQRQEKQNAEDAIALQRRRREEDRLAQEQEETARRKRIADLQQQRDLERSVAEARQMSVDQRITREVMGQGAYDPREEVERLKQVEAQTGRTAAGMRGLKGDIGNAALAMAYFADDAQYGLRGIMNNIPQLALMLGLGGGLTGVISVAAVAVNVLWEKFGGAKEAAQQTEEAKEKTEALAGAINDAVQASGQLFDTRFDKYLAGLREATELWAKQKGHISEALGYQNALAKAQEAAAVAQLETDRQRQLGSAKTDEERAAINSRFDAQKGQLTDRGKGEAMDRARGAQELAENSLKARIKDAEAARDAAMQTADNLREQNQSQSGGLGTQSDQARRRQSSIAAQAGVDGLDNLGRDLTEKENERRNKFIQQREEADVTKAEDEARLRSGQGLTFDKAKEDAKSRGDLNSYRRYEEAEKQAADNAEAAAKASKEAVDADAKIFELKLELLSLEKQGMLLKAQQLAQQAEAEAAEAKRITDAKIADQKQQEIRDKKQREEAARKAENDAKELEIKGDAEGAAKKRGDAARTKLSPTATAEEKRGVDLDAQERERAARDKASKGRPEAVTDASSLIGPLSNLAQNLGPAGSELAKAVQQLREGGATAKEMQHVVQLVEALTPIITKRFGDQQQQITALKNAVSNLSAQVRTSKL